MSSQRPVSLCLAAVLLLSSALSACTPKPQLLENTKYKKVGSSEASDDIERCMNEAKVKLDGVSGTIEKETQGAAAGAAVSTATSGITSASTSVGGVNLSGSVADGVSNSVSDLFTDQSDNPEYRRLVDACLRRQGYRVSSWN